MTSAPVPSKSIISVLVPSVDDILDDASCLDLDVDERITDLLRSFNLETFSADARLAVVESLWALDAAWRELEVALEDGADEARREAAVADEESRT